MRIIVDVMGGDNAPDAIALGAIEAAKEEKLDVVLVGRGEAILQCLKNHGIETLPAGVEIANADDVVDMHDDPAAVIKTRKNSSMLVGLQMLKDGGGDAFVSAGSTGALLTAATLEFLLQFAFMGSYYAKKMLGISNPRVALLNIGAEDSKGTQLQKDAYALLQKAADAGYVNFIGNIEARGVPLGEADVVVSDGFSGNVLLKGIEGTALFMSGMLKDLFKKNISTKLAAAMCMSGIKEFKSKLDYRQTGGTVLIGLTKPVIKAHGSSDAVAIHSAIRQAAQAVSSGFTDDIRANVEQMMVPKELEHVQKS